MQDPEDMLNAIGYGGLSVSKVSTRLKDEYEKLFKPEDEPITEVEQIVTKPVNHSRIRSNNGIIVDGEYGCAVKFARCCNPLPGDDIIGFITRGYGISIHKKSCKNITEGSKDKSFAERLVHAEWDHEAVGDNNGSLFEAVIQIFAIQSFNFVKILKSHTLIFNHFVSISFVNNFENSRTTINTASRARPLKPRRRHSAA